MNTLEKLYQYHNVTIYAPINLFNTCLKVNAYSSKWDIVGKTWTKYSVSLLT